MVLEWFFNLSVRNHSSMAQKSVMIDNFVENWNAKFPEYQLSVEDLKKSHSMMGALFLILDRLGIDKEAVLMPAAEKNINEHVTYYHDLLPVINMTRVINHVLSITPQMANISINHFLQPTAPTSYTILLLLFNLLVFNEQHLQSIAPYEEELFDFSNKIKSMEEQKAQLFEMLNKRAVEKGKRADRMEQMDKEIQQLEEELKQEELAKEEEKQQLELLIKENKAAEVLLEQKRATKESLIAERERKRALRVYDAEDVKGQAAQAAQNVKEVEEKLSALQATIAQKQHSLQILQTIKPNLDTANNLLHEITKLKDYELGDIEEDSKDGELELLQTDLVELRAQHAELSDRRHHLQARAQHDHAARQRDKTAAESALREAVDKDKKRREFTAHATQRIQEVKLATTEYEEEKAKGFANIKQMKEEFNTAMKTWEESLYKLVADVKNDINKKMSFNLDE